MEMVMSFQPRALSLFSAALLVMVADRGTSDAEDLRISRQEGNDTKDPVTLALTCDKKYLAGFPLLVAVELHKAEDSFELFPFFDLFTIPGPIAFTLRGEGREWTWATMSRRSHRTDDEPEGMEFGPGKRWYTLQDLSELHPDIPPGKYELSAEALFLGYIARSEKARIEILATSKGDRAIASKLRATNDDKRSSWQAFVLDNWSTPKTHGLSSVARARLAYYLYLHRVAYGPSAISALDPEEPWRWGHGVLEAEAAVVRLEILHAAKKSEAAGVEEALLERWPGLAWRVENIHRNEGFLTTMRASYGVERDDPPVGKTRPYEHK
jgi:hypothetical protein